MDLSVAWLLVFVQGPIIGKMTSRQGTGNAILSEQATNFGNEKKKHKKRIKRNRKAQSDKHATKWKLQL